MPCLRCHVEDGPENIEMYSMDTATVPQIEWPSPENAGRIVAEVDPKEFCLNNLLGLGGFGQVYKVNFRDSTVAIKVFTKWKCSSWAHESSIHDYLGAGSPHISNIICTDIDKRIKEKFKYWIMFQYYEHGCLYKYLKKNHLEEEQLLEMALGISSGLKYIHEPFRGFQSPSKNSKYKYKPPIYHGDIKPMNIFLDKNLAPVIGDFGMARPKWEEGKKEETKRKAEGTMRYLAPEILACQDQEEFAKLPFETFQLADMYSFGLVLWEMTNRTRFVKYFTFLNIPWYSPPHEYVVAYQNESLEASEEEMKSLVVHQGIRPRLLDEWLNNITAKKMRQIMTSCWSSSLRQRPNSARVHKELLLFYKSLYK